MGTIKLVKARGSKNLILNPRFNSATTGYSTGGTNTLSLHSLDSYFGENCAKITYNDNTILLSYSLTKPTNWSDLATACVRVRVDNTWDGGAIQVGFSNGVTVSLGSTTLKNEWVKIKTYWDWDGQTSTILRITCSSAPTAGKFILVDGVMFFHEHYDPTYFDGDYEGCHWLGKRHASISVQRLDYGLGGELLDLSDDLNFGVEKFDGLGFAPSTPDFLTLGLIDGEKYQGQYHKKRSIGLTGSIIAATTYAQYHEFRNKLIKALTRKQSSLSPENTLVRMYYCGAAEVKYIDVVFVDGLGATQKKGYAEDGATLNFFAPDPFWYSERLREKTVSYNGSVTFSKVLRRIKDDDFNSAIGNYWLSDGNTAGASTSIDKFVECNGIIYMVGDFTNLGGDVNADYVASYDPYTDTFNSMGSGTTDGAVFDIAVGGDNKIYVCGKFSTMRGVSANRIARYTPDTGLWDEPFPHSTSFLAAEGVFNIHYDKKGLFWASGSFTDFNSISGADHIAYYDGGWNKLNGTSTFYPPFAVYDSDADNLYFTAADISAIDVVYKYNYSTITTLLGDSTGTVFGLKIHEGSLYMYGAFSSFNNISIWNGTTFVDFTDSVASTITSIAFDGDDMYIAGSNSITQNQTDVAVWNGSAFAPIDLYTNSAGSAPLTVFVSKTGELYIGTVRSNQVAQNGYVNLVSYEGTAIAYPTIEIGWNSGGTAVTFYTIGNLTVGSLIHFESDLRQGETILITTSPRKDGVYSSFLGEYNTAISGYNLSNFYLLPSQDENGNSNRVLVFMREGNGSEVASCKMRWHDSFVSFD